MPIIDLTMTLENGQTGVQITPKYTVEENGWNATTLQLYSHIGTHMDAPFHFGVSSQTVDQIPLSRLLVPGRVVHVEVDGPGHVIELDSVASQLEHVSAGQAVLLKTGWSRHFGNRTLYRDGLPRISEPLANYLVRHQIGLVGVEPPSVADVNNLEEVTRIHQILLGGDVVIVEGLTNLDAIGDGTFTFGAMPLKIGNGDGSPCRAFALTDN